MNGLTNDLSQWKIIYRIGAISGIIALGVLLLDIVFGSSQGTADLNILPQTAVERYIQFKANPILGLYFLDLLNVINNFFMIPFLFAVTLVHRNKNIPLALLSFIIYTLGIVFFISNNVALPMYDLAAKYATETNETQKTLLAAAGEALLAKGAHGRPGNILGFVIPGIGIILYSIVLLQGKIFNKTISIIGLIAFIPLLLYAPLITFMPSTKSIALFIAAPGGIMMIVWMIMIIVKLFKLSQNDNV
jgi:hypothetical protein